MSERHEVEIDFDNAENLLRRIHAIQKIQADLLDGHVRDRLLASMNVQTSRRFVIPADANGIVPTYHHRIALIPQARHEVLHGIARLIAAVPAYGPELAGSVPRPLVENEPELRAHSRDIAMLAGNDIFLEIRDETDASKGYFLVNPEGVCVYRAAEDVVSLLEPTNNMISNSPDSFFALRPEVAREAVLSPEFEWGLLEAIEAYEPIVQDNRRRAI